ncbi:MAG: hypothetical protein CM15mP23_08800 [Cryomorphaceae bacterium]|nr:MAG: hypothetical protein CM15mP23_08800 [Cryomorphaceae bacterium]
MHRYIPVLSKSAGYPKICEKVVQHQERKYGATKFGMERFINGFLDFINCDVYVQVWKNQCICLV